MQSNVVLISFTESSKCYEYLTRLQQLDADGKLTLNSAAVLSRSDDGQLKVEDGNNQVSGTATLGGGLVGSLVGILGGPVGVLLGWASGALIGGAVDADSADSALTVLDKVAESIPNGGTALIAHVDEVDPRLLDESVTEDGGTVERWDAEELLGDIEAAQEAKADEAREARKEAREAKRAQRKEDIHAKLEAFKNKITGHDTAQS